LRNLKNPSIEGLLNSFLNSLNKKYPLSKVSII
ncbi:MAG: hypothetical protein ACI85O_001088, partial [Saprospiraceae bacterium]